MDRLAIYVNTRLRRLIKPRGSYLRPMPEGLRVLEEQISRIIEYQQSRRRRDNPSLDN